MVYYRHIKQSKYSNADLVRSVTKKALIKLFGFLIIIYSKELKQVRGIGRKSPALTAYFEINYKVC